ncbi:MAG: hypothetical protein N3F63_07790 [Thermoplasmata archaeon]|nr:hypothetical protein [Thermoplasmata archaeon]
MLQQILVDLKKRGVGAVETFARRGSATNPSGPMEFYLLHGFSVFHDNKEFPLMRIELKTGWFSSN